MGPLRILPRSLFEPTPQYRIITIFMVSMEFGPVNRTPSPSINCTTPDNCEVTVYVDFIEPRAFAQQNTRQQDFTSIRSNWWYWLRSAHGTATPRAPITAMRVGALAEVIHNKDGSARAYLTREVLILWYPTRRERQKGCGGCRRSDGSAVWNDKAPITGVFARA